LNNGKHVGGEKGEPSPIKNFGRTMGDLDNKGERYTWGPRKIDSSPKGFSRIMEGGAHNRE